MQSTTWPAQGAANDDVMPTAAFDAFAHAIWGGLADAGVPFERRQSLATALLDELLPVFRAGSLDDGDTSHPVRFAFDPSRREPVSA